MGNTCPQVVDECPTNYDDDDDTDYQTDRHCYELYTVTADNKVFRCGSDPQPPDDVSTCEKTQVQSKDFSFFFSKSFCTCPSEVKKCAEIFRDNCIPGYFYELDSDCNPSMCEPLIDDDYDYPLACKAQQLTNKIDFKTHPLFINCDFSELPHCYRKRQDAESSGLDTPRIVLIVASSVLFVIMVLLTINFYFNLF